MHTTNDPRQLYAVASALDKPQSLDLNLTLHSEGGDITTLIQTFIRRGDSRQRRAKACHGTGPVDRRHEQALLQGAETIRTCIPDLRAYPVFRHSDPPDVVQGLLWGSWGV